MTKPKWFLNPPRTTLHIQVTDDNDNAPVFTRDSVSQVELLENTRVKSVIGKVEATDEDEGLNGQVWYEINSESDREGVFQVDTQRGFITLTKKLNFKITRQYKLWIIAHDFGKVSQSSRHGVSVLVLHYNMHPPSIKISSFSGTSNPEIIETANEVKKLENIKETKLEINEEALKGIKGGGGNEKISGVREQLVVYVEVSDEDDPFSNSSIQCGVNDHRFKLSRLHRNNFVLKSMFLFDREVASSVRVNITCHDNGNPRLQSCKEVVIDIADVNDNFPVVTESCLEVRVKKTLNVGTEVCGVKASDADGGENARLVFSMPNSSVLRVDALTGVVSVGEGLRLETKPELVLAVQVKDSGRDVQLTTVTSILVHVIDYDVDLSNATASTLFSRLQQPNQFFLLLIISAICLFLIFLFSLFFLAKYFMKQKQKPKQPDIIDTEKAFLNGKPSTDLKVATNNFNAFVIDKEKVSAEACGAVKDSTKPSQQWTMYPHINFQERNSHKVSLDHKL